jgi:hypothetical protein
MEFSVLGFKINVLNALIFAALGFLVATMTVASCSKVSVKEAMTNLANAAPLGDMGNAELMNSWTSKAHAYAGNMGYEDVLEQHKQYQGTPVPLKEGQLFYFEDNKFRPECCPSKYSTSTGCACISEDQMTYLNERGGNRTLPTEF